MEWWRSGTELCDESYLLIILIDSLFKNSFFIIYSMTINSHVFIEERGGAAAGRESIFYKFLYVRYFCINKLMWH